MRDAAWSQSRLDGPAVAPLRTWVEFYAVWALMLLICLGFWGFLIWVIVAAVR